MNYITKVASYFDAYNNSDNKEELVKVASTEGVSSDELVAFHNLTEGNIFTGENLIKTASLEDSAIVATGFLLDAFHKGEISKDVLLKEASEIDMDAEDVSFINDNIERQLAEATVGEGNGEAIDKVAEVLNFFAANDIDPEAGIELALNLETKEDGAVPMDDKTASIMDEIEPDIQDKVAQAAFVLSDIPKEDIANYAIELLG